MAGGLDVSYNAALINQSYNTTQRNAAETSSNNHFQLIDKI